MAKQLELQECIRDTLPEEYKVLQAQVAIQKELRQATSVFAGSIAHDLRNPLTSIVLLTDLVTAHSQKLKRLISIDALPDKELQTEIAACTEQSEAWLAQIKNITYHMNDSIR